MDAVSMSKRLSWLLRHGAAKEGLSIARDASVLADDVLRRRDFWGITLEDLRWLVSSSDKKRFDLFQDSSGEWRIRAVQGWTDDVGEAVDDGVAMQELRSARELEQLGFTCCHGTWLESWKAIKIEGLKRMSRKHIHFACHTPGVGEVISGMRTECEVLIFLDAERFMDAGGRLYRSKNNVLLTEGLDGGTVPPAFFKRAVQRRPRTGQLWPEQGQSGHIPGLAPGQQSGHVPGLAPPAAAAAAADAYATRPPRQPPAPQGGAQRGGAQRGDEQAAKRWGGQGHGRAEGRAAAEPPAEAGGGGGQEDAEKKAKRLQKALAGVERTEQKQRQGQALTQEELDKLKRKADLQRELRELQGGRVAGSPAVPDAWDDNPAVVSSVSSPRDVPDSWDELAARTPDKKDAEVEQVEAQPVDAPASDEDREKTAKRLAKMLAAIERLEEKRQQGHALSQEELSKLRRKADLGRELRELRAGGQAEEGRPGGEAKAAAQGKKSSRGAPPSGR